MKYTFFSSDWWVPSCCRLVSRRRLKHNNKQTLRYAPQEDHINRRELSKTHPEFPAGTVMKTREKAIVDSRDFPSTTTETDRQISKEINRYAPLFRTNSKTLTKTAHLL